MHSSRRSNTKTPSMTVKPFFYICVGLTLSLPLFYIDLAVAEFFAKNRATSTEQAKEVRADWTSLL